MRTLIKAFGDFELYHEEFENIDHEKCQALDVDSKGAAKKHVIEIRLNGRTEQFKDSGVKKYLYSNCYVSHGMRGEADTLAETKEYIDALTAALDAAFEVQKYCILNGWWKA